MALIKVCSLCDTPAIKARQRKCRHCECTAPSIWRKPTEGETAADTAARERRNKFFNELLGIA